jgi:diaminohydroxyphosphoribosylaminopyrimidine deaminase / 5-amino-6-(5-phosphoribosylamino)uracil reductase
MSAFSANDYRFMAEAIELARRGCYTTTPNPNVGCVIVNNGQVVGRGWHQKAGQPHAEVYALKQAAEKAQGATAYVTLEPCSHHGRTPPCCDALIDAKVCKVIAAMQDPNPMVAGKGLARISASGIETHCGLMKSEAEQLNRGFISRMRHARPFVQLKVASSIDGRTAMATGESKWITCSQSRQDVHTMRAGSCAIVTGVGTVAADDPSLTVRHQPENYPAELRQPLRVICDSTLSVNEAAKIFDQAGETWVVCVEAEKDKRQRLEARGVRVITLPFERSGVSLSALLTCLAENEINTVMVEAGATLAGSFLQAGLVDELVLYMAPHLMGNDARAMLNLPGLEKMSDRIKLSIKDVRQIGQDLRLILVQEERK